MCSKNLKRVPMHYFLSKIIAEHHLPDSPFVVIVCLFSFVACGVAQCIPLHLQLSLHSYLSIIICVSYEIIHSAHNEHSKSAQWCTQKGV